MVDNHIGMIFIRTLEKKENGDSDRVISLLDMLGGVCQNNGYELVKNSTNMTLGDDFSNYTGAEERYQNGNCVVLNKIDIHAGHMITEISYRCEADIESIRNKLSALYGTKPETFFRS